MAGARLTDRRARAVKAGDKPITHGGVGGLCLTPSTKHNGQGSWVLEYKDPLTQTRVRIPSAVIPKCPLLKPGGLGQS